MYDLTLENLFIIVAFTAPAIFTFVWCFVDEYRQDKERKSR